MSGDTSLDEELHFDRVLGHVIYQHNLSSLPLLHLHFNNSYRPCWNLFLCENIQDK